MTTLTSPLLTSTRVQWNAVDEGLHVANRDGDFFGYIDRNDDGSFVAFDQFSTPVGRYGSLAAAKASLMTVTSDPVNLRRRRSRERIPFIVATWMGLLATATAVTAGVLFPAF